MIAQFSVVEAPGDARGVRLLLVLQSHFVEADTVVVAPLRTYEAPPAKNGLLIECQVAGERLLVDIAQLGAVRRSQLKKVVGSLAAHEDEIRRAIERVFSGF